jgi:phosphohistidine phosphatase
LVRQCAKVLVIMSGTFGGETKAGRRLPHDGGVPGRRLIVMRHARAGELPGGPDIERALLPRGRRDSEAAGHWLADNDLQPDLVLCSAARRTRQTWQQIAEALAHDAHGGLPDVLVERRLYQANVEDLAEIIGQTAPEVRTLLYIGHNPEAAGLVGLLTGTQPDFPTAAIAVIAVPGDWADLTGRADATLRYVGSSPRADTTAGGELIASWVPRSRN